MALGIISISSLPGQSASSVAGLTEGLAKVTPCFISPEGLHVGDIDAAQTFLAAFVGSAQQLAHNQAASLASLGLQYVGLFAAGFNYSVPGDASGLHNYQIDPASIGNITAAGSWATSLVALTSVPSPLAPWPNNFIWIDSVNVAVPMTAEQCAAFATAAGAYVTALILNNRALKTAISAAPDMATLQAIDITAGWPTNAPA
jgi:hypothetical protein